MPRRKISPLEQAYLEKIGRRLQMYRMQRKMPIAALARTIDLSSSAVDWHESGRSSMSLLTAYRYSVALRVPLTDLLKE